MPAEGVLPLTSTSEVHVPPRGRSFMKFSFDFPEPSFEIDGLKIGFLVFTYENAYGLDEESMTIARYGPDAYFLDIVGGWVNNPVADMHEGTRLLVEELRRRYPSVLAVGEMHYDALLSLLPLYHSFSATALAGEHLKFARFFQHLSHPAPGRGSTGVHEAGFQKWNPESLSLTEHQIPTLNVVDDSFEKYRPEMTAVIRRARERAGI